MISRAGKRHSQAEITAAFYFAEIINFRILDMTMVKYIFDFLDSTGSRVSTMLVSR